MSEEHNQDTDIFDQAAFEALDELLADADSDTGEAENEMAPGAAKLDADYAGYMELPGAAKDGDCQVVYVEDGISKDKGCCNLFHPKSDADKFSCGTCKYED